MILRLRCWLHGGHVWATWDDGWRLSYDLCALCVHTGGDAQAQGWRRRAGF